MYISPRWSKTRWTLRNSGWTSCWFTGYGQTLKRWLGRILYIALGIGEKFRGWRHFLVLKIRVGSQMALPFYFIQIDKFLLLTTYKSALSIVQVAAMYSNHLSTWIDSDIHTISVYIIASASIGYRSSLYLHRVIRPEPLVFSYWGVAPRVADHSRLADPIIKTFVCVAVNPDARLILQNEFV